MPRYSLLVASTQDYPFRLSCFPALSLSPKVRNHLLALPDQTHPSTTAFPPSQHHTSTLKQPRADSFEKKAKMRLYHPPTLGKTHTYFSRRTLVSLPIAVGVSLFLITSPPPQPPLSHANRRPPRVRNVFPRGQRRPTMTTCVARTMVVHPPEVVLLLLLLLLTLHRIYDLTITQPSPCPIHPDAVPLALKVQYRSGPASSRPTHTRFQIERTARTTTTTTTLFCKRESPAVNVAVVSRVFVQIALSFFFLLVLPACLLAFSRAGLHTHTSQWSFGWGLKGGSNTSINT